MRALRTPRLGWLLAATAAVYFAALLLTEAVFVGDAPDYARQITARLIGRDCEFVDAGHLLWRPLGFFMYSLSGGPIAGPTHAVWLAILRQLTFLAQAAGLATMLATIAWLWRRTDSASAAGFGASLLLFSHAFLNYAQTGTSYVAGLAGLMLAFLTLYPAPQGPPSPARSIAGGLFLSISVLAWLPYVLALPGAVLWLVVLAPRDRRSWRTLALTAGTFALAAGGALILAGRSLGLSTLDGYREWIARAGHGISGSGGGARALLGFARSFVDVGDFGQVVKRFLLHDAARPVAPQQLLSVHLVQLSAFYLALAAVGALALGSSAGRRALVLLALLALPVAGMALFWQGGDLERYLALTPGVALVAAEAFRNAASRRIRWVLVAFMALVLVSNLALLARPRVAQAQAQALARLRGVPAGTAPRLLIVSHAQDGIAEFNRNFPLHPANREALHVYPLVTPGLPSVGEWRRDFEREVAGAWQAGRTVWVSERLQEPAPRADSNWVEGDPASLPWARLREVFVRLEYEERSGVGGDGFRRLEPQPHNWEVFAEVEPKPWLTPRPPGCDLPEALGGQAR